jgi:hypothetical protein
MEILFTSIAKSMFVYGKFNGSIKLSGGLVLENSCTLLIKYLAENKTDENRFFYNPIQRTQ